MSWDSEFFSLPIARRAAQDAGRDPDALKTAMRLNLEPGTSVDPIADRLKRLAEAGTDEAIVDAFAMFDSLDQLLDFAGQVITGASRLQGPRRFTTGPVLARG